MRETWVESLTAEIGADNDVVSTSYAVAEILNLSGAQQGQVQDLLTEMHWSSTTEIVERLIARFGSRRS